MPAIRRAVRLSGAVVVSSWRSRGSEQRWIGQDNGGGHIAIPCHHHGGLMRHSLTAAFTGHHGIGLNAAKRAVGLRVP